MNDKELEVKVALQIQKCADGVFEATVNPDKMTQYFISKSTGWMEEGQNLIWNFPEFKAGAQRDALVHISEKGMKCDGRGIAWLSGNTMGWTNFLACLKAYLKYGISLRKGGFDFMRDNI